MYQYFLSVYKDSDKNCHCEACPDAKRGNWPNNPITFYFMRFLHPAKTGFGMTPLKRIIFINAEA